MNKFILHNHDLLREDSFSLKINNRSFLYSDGFFESIKVINSRCFNLETHFNRITKTAELFKMKISFSFSELQSLLDNLIVKNKIVGGSVRMVFYRDSEGKYFPEENKMCFVAETETSLNGFNINKNGLNLGIFTDIRKDKSKYSNCKTTNAVISVLASIYAKENNWDDCLLLNTENNIIESSNSNLFIVKGDRIITPPIADGCVDGTMRSFIKNQFDVEEESISKEDLFSVDDVFLTNAIKGVRWAESFNEKKYQSHKVARLVFDIINS
jgi:branched-chain amino acid aminotransferase